MGRGVRNEYVTIRNRVGDIGSDSGRLTFLKETARSQEWLVLRATNAPQTMSRWLLFTKKSRIIAN